MLTILINWIYIFLTAFSLGFAFSRFSEKVLHYRIKRMDSILMSGLIIATVYAQIFSLFYRVNVEANLVLMAVCVIIYVFMGGRMFRYVREVLRGSSLTGRILVPVLLLAWCFYTSRGYMVPDMNTYHGQAIRWIEEYGAVKGLGIINGRFGYNSSIFVLSALYSMKFILGTSLHAVNGFIAFLLSTMTLDLGKCFKRKKMLLSDYARVGAVYYLTTIIDEVIAPSADYAVMCTIFFIVIKWLTQLEEEDGERRSNIAPYALLCVAGAYTLTLKLTAGLILILLIKPAYRLLKEKRWKEIAVYLLMGLLTTVPWMARTVIITGWLFYPFPALDLFHFDWKMTNIGQINTDAAEIKVWAKGANALGINAKLSEWFPNWFRTCLYTTEKLLIVADIAAGVLFVVMTVAVLIRKQWKKLDLILVLGTVFCSYLFWQLTAPMMRYGYAYVLLEAALMTGYLLEHWRFTARAAYVFFLLYGAYKAYICVDWITGYSYYPGYLWQATYEVFDAETYEVDGVTFYYNPQSASLGYEVFPATYAVEDWFELRGNNLKDGFRFKEEN